MRHKEPQARPLAHLWYILVIHNDSWKKKDSSISIFKLVSCVTFQVIQNCQLYRKKPVHSLAIAVKAWHFIEFFFGSKFLSRNFLIFQEGAQKHRCSASVLLLLHDLGLGSILLKPPKQTLFDFSMKSIAYVYLYALTNKYISIKSIAVVFW